MAAKPFGRLRLSWNFGATVTNSTMAQDYDKILKENMEALILPLADKLLGLSLGPTEELPDDLQTTLERKPDLLKRIAGTSATGNAGHWNASRR